MSASPAASPIGTAAPSRRRWLTLTTVAIAQLMVVLDVTIVNIALPSAQQDLDFSDGARQWVVTAYSLAFGSLLLLGGRLSDLIGRKTAFIVGLVGFAGSSALGGAAQSFEMLVAARAFQGAFGALLAPTALAVLTVTFTIQKERARAFGVFGAIAGAGAAIGLLLGGVLTEYLDWRWTLFINVAFAALAVLGAIAFVPRAGRVTPRPRLDVPGTLLVCLGLFSLVYGLANAETDGWESPLTWGFLAAFVVLIAAFVWRQRRASEPLLPLSIVLDRDRAASYLSILIAGGGMFGVLLFVTYYVQETLGYTPMQAGLAFLPMVGMLIVMAQLSTIVLLPRLGPRILVPSGMVLATIGALLLTRLDADSTYAAHILPALMIFGAGMGAIMPPSVQTATFGLDRGHAGVGSAVVNTSQQVGGSIGTALLNTLVATAVADYAAAHAPASPEVLAEAKISGYAVAYWWGAGFYAVGALIAVLLFRSKRSREAMRASMPAVDPAEAGAAAAL